MAHESLLIACFLPRLTKLKNRNKIGQMTHIYNVHSHDVHSCTGGGDRDTSCRTGRSRCSRVVHVDSPCPPHTVVDTVCHKTVSPPTAGGQDSNLFLLEVVSLRLHILLPVTNYICLLNSTNGKVRMRYSSWFSCISSCSKLFKNFKASRRRITYCILFGWGLFLIQRIMR